MRITRIAVEGVGRFSTPTEVVGLGDGVNILAAANEAGKSTLFRAVRACLFERHNTKNEAVRALASEGLSLPVAVTLGFDLGGESYVLRKSFLKSVAASLARGGREIAKDRAADETAWELLGIEPGSGRQVDAAAFGLLWVEQGQSFHAPAPSEAAATTLNAAVQAEVGTLVGGTRARTVLAAIRDELARLVTDTGRPKAGGPLATANAGLETVERDLAAAEHRLAVLDDQLVALAGKRAERARLADPALVTTMHADLDAARRELKAGEGAAARVAEIRGREREANASVERAERTLADLRQQAERIGANRKREAELAAAAAPLEAEAAAARAAIDAARAAVDGLDGEAEALERREHGLQRIGEATGRAAGREALERRRATLAAIGERRVAIAAALAGNRATAAAVAALDKAERQLAIVAARLEAAAPRVAVAIGPAGGGVVVVDGRPLADDVVAAAVDAMTIRVGDLATVTVTPAAADADDRQARRRLQAELATVLAEAGAADADGLRAARARRQALEGDAAGIAAELAALGLKDTSPGVEIERIRGEVAIIDAELAAALAEAGLDTLPTADEIAAAREVLRLGRERIRQERRRLEAAAAAHSAALAKIADARGNLDGSRAEVRGSLAADLAMLPDEDRPRRLGEAEAMLAAARDEHRIRAAALAAELALAPAADELERRRIRVGRLESASDNHKARLDGIDRDLANLEGQIQSAGGDGLGETVEILRAERDLVRREAERHAGRAATLQLLKETVEAAYQEQRERLNAPLRRHLQPFLHDVFPAAELSLGDGFAVGGMRRDGPAAEDFERLSAGTQEQIAVLVRLAMGAMLAGRGDPVPIILDDALVFSDDERIAQMFDAISRAGRTQQVIVLTCRTRAFATLGGRQLAIAPIA